MCDICCSSLRRRPEHWIETYSELQYFIVTWPLSSSSIHIFISTTPITNHCLFVSDAFNPWAMITSLRPNAEEKEKVITSRKRVNDWCSVQMKCCLGGHPLYSFAWWFIPSSNFAVLYVKTNILTRPTNFLWTESFFFKANTCSFSPLTSSK